MINEIRSNVRQALAEDIGTGDLTALLIDAEKTLTASVISRENTILCGIEWFETCFQSLSPDTQVRWLAKEGEALRAEQEICKIKGNARALLSAERPALNFLQMMSAVAAQTKRYVEAVSGTNAVIVDTRKTLPGLRFAQKYAVKCGGGVNHRFGLYDGILIKENHIIVAGGIEIALDRAQKIASTDKLIQIEVESLEELQIALAAGAKMILLDNFSLDQLRDAVMLTNQQSGKRAMLEASGNINLENVHKVAETGVDRISIGSLTKDIQAVDLSMRFSEFVI